MPITMGWIAVTVTIVLSSFIAAQVAADYPHPGTPATWICLTTAGGNARNGGWVNYTNCGNITDMCAGPKQGTQWMGWVGAIIAVAFFGSNFIPVKKFDTGDGLFFQWVVCIGIWLTGVVINMILVQPPFFLPALLGGVLWTTGNLMVVPIVKMIGLTMGLTVWGVTNMLAGWVTGVLILKQTPQCPGLNYGGVALVVVSVVILAFVKSEGKKPVKVHATEHAPSAEEEPLLGNQSNSLEGSLRARVLKKESKFGSSIQNQAEDVDDKLVFSTPLKGKQQGASTEQDADFSWVDRLGVWPRRVLGFGLALISGLLYGFMFLPVQFMKLCDDSAHSCSDVDYLFGYYSGILFVSSFYFMVYSAARRNKPMIYPKLILPGLISGIMWGVAMFGWFWANQYLSLSVSVPIATAGPGFVSSAWGIFIFKEVKGWKNILLYFVAFVVSLCGLVMDGLSRCTVHC